MQCSAPATGHPDANQLQDIYDVIAAAGAASHAKSCRGPGSTEQQTAEAISRLVYTAHLPDKVLQHEPIKPGIQSTPEGIRDFRKQVFDDDQHELKDLSLRVTSFASEVATLLSRSGASVHHRDPEKLLEAEHLAFCGFMLPRRLQWHLTSNWGEFESNNPSMFQSMFQFWAYKPHQQ